MQFTYIPRKSKAIYNYKIAHRGYHMFFPENTIAAYVEAINRNYAIELDVRITIDNYIICIHDRHSKRLLGVSGKVSSKTLDEIRKYNVINSNQKVPLLEEVLYLVNGRVPILIEVKGLLTDIYELKLYSIISRYDGEIYFHAKNIITYYRLRRIWKDKVFWVLNPFRRRFDFMKRYFPTTSIDNN